MLGIEGTYLFLTKHQYHYIHFEVEETKREVGLLSD